MLESLDDGIGVFALDRFFLYAVDFFGALVVSKLDAIIHFLVVHDVGLEKEDRAFIDSVGE